MQTKPSVTSVHSFWNTAACGTHFVEQYENEWDFFDRYRERRYRTEWHIPLLVTLPTQRGKLASRFGWYLFIFASK